MAARAPLFPAPKWLFTLIFGFFTLWFGFLTIISLGLGLGGILCGVCTIIFGYLTFRSIITPRRQYDALVRRWTIIVLIGAIILAILYYLGFV
jgi:hypothetical protein